MPRLSKPLQLAYTSIVARPKGPTFSQDIQDAIINRIAAGETLRAICADPDYPDPGTVVKWCDASESYAQRYARARKLGYDAIADETLKIADDTSEDANSRRVRVDTRKWLLSKLRPDKYGDHLTLGGDAANPLIPPKITVEFVQAIARPVAPELPEGE